MDQPTPHDDFRVSERAASPAPTPPQPAKAASAPWWRQLLVTLVVLVAALYGWALVFPGGSAMLERAGVTLPFLPAAAPAEMSAAGAPRGPGPGGMRGPGNRQAAVVVTATVGSAVINDRLMAIGEGSAARSSTLTSAVGGTLAAIAVTPGQWVEAGTQIAQLDSASQQIAYDRARLAYEDASAALARATELASSNAISSVQLNAAQLTAGTAELEMRNAELALASRSITAPIAGTVGLLQVSPGNLVNAQTVVTTIEDTSDILVNFWVPERYAPAIEVGLPVTATAVALPGQTFTGTISAVDNRIDPQSRTLQVQALIPNDAGRIRAGMSFQITMSFAGETFPSVDPLAIQWSADGAYVWKYAEGKVDRVLVQIIQRNSDGVLVKGDIAPGDQVVTQGVQQLTAGASVRLLDELGISGPGGQRPEGQS